MPFGAEQGGRAFFGRRKGKALRAAQARALDSLLPSMRLPLESPAPRDPRSLFAAPVADIRLEIGFGGGEHLLAALAGEPRTGFIGIEPFVNGMARLLAAISPDPPGNLRLYDRDAVEVLEWLPAGSVAGIDLFYPDPWPKRRHWKRRFVSAANLDRMARVMRRGALFRFASDIADYVDWTLLHCRDHSDFEWLAQTASDWLRPFPGWPGTRYEAKALSAGRRPAYLAFRRR